MRNAVFLLCGLYALLLVWLAYDTATMSTDAAGRGMAWGFYMIGAGVTALCALPALGLAAANKALGVALAFALTPAALVLFGMAAGVL